MGELLPLTFGVVVGLVVGLRHGRLRLWAVVALCVSLGAAASWINGELAGSAWLILFDSAQVLAAFAMTVTLARRLAPGSSRR